MRHLGPGARRSCSSSRIGKSHRAPLLAVLGALWAASTQGAAAQDRPAPAVEFSSGWAGFADDSVIHHGLVGGSARFYVTPRLSIGPEFVYLVGPRSDRDLTLSGNLTFDVLGPVANRPRRITPYLVAGGGLFQHRDRFVGRTLKTTEGAFTGGGGVRVFLTRRLFVAPEARIGWELHLRVSGTVGWQLR